MNQEVDVSFLFDYWCLDFNSTYPPILQGAVDQNGIYNELTFSIVKCVNTTENGNFCKSPEEIQEKLNLFYIDVRYGNIEIDLTNEQGIFPRL